MYLSLLLLFFFSSRRRHTRFKCDWSSDVCSSDLAFQFGAGQYGFAVLFGDRLDRAHWNVDPIMLFQLRRRPRKRMVRPEIRDGSLQRFRALAACDFSGFDKRSNLGSPPPQREDLLGYLDPSESRVPIEFFLLFPFTPGFPLNCSSFLPH